MVRDTLSAVGVWVDIIIGPAVVKMGQHDFQGCSSRRELKFGKYVGDAYATSFPALAGQIAV